jgi:WD40 repeat protein
LNISEIVYANDKIYASADNAIFSYDIVSQDLETITTIEGLSGDLISTFHYSTNYQLLIIGYENGLIEIFNEATKEVLSVVDIINKTTIPPENKQINHFYEHQDELYISTNYGISVYRLDNLEFGDTFYIGNIGNQIPVKQTAVYNNTIYANCGNNEGIKSIALSNPNLIDYQQWFSAVSGEFVFLASNDGQLIVTSNVGVTFRLNDNNSLTQLVVNSEPPVDVYFSDDYFVTTLEASLKIYDTNFNLISALSLPTEYQGTIVVFND